MAEVLLAYKTDVGQRRDHNEDFIWVNEEAGVFIVADGLGGHQAGEVASQMAAKMVGKAVVDYVQQHPRELLTEDIAHVLISALERANTAVSEAAQNNVQQRDMGTTLVVALFQLPDIYICHAGDSRAYLVSDAGLKQLTDDDTFQAQFNAASGNRNILTKAIGQQSRLDPQFLLQQAAPGDWLLLCSDGLWDPVGDEQLLIQTQQADADPVRLVEVLVDMANEAGGPDNISVIAIKIESP